MSSPVKLTPQQEELLVSLVFKKDLGAYLGPFLIGLVIDCYLCGLILVQFQRYLERCKGDQKIIMFYVFFGMFLGVGSTISLIAYSMNNFVYGFGSFLQFADIKFTQVFVVVDAFTSVTVQSFYAQRVYKLLKNSKIFVVAFIPIACIELGAMASTLIIFNTKFHNILDADKLIPYVYLGMGSQITADLFITCCTAFGLWSSRTGWAGTDKVIQRLVAVTVETQLPPTIIAIVHIILYAQNTSSMYYISISFFLGKPYIIGMLAVLNARRGLRSNLGNPGDLSSYNSSRPRPNTSVHYEYNSASEGTDGRTAVGSQQSQDKSAYGLLSTTSTAHIRFTESQPIVDINYDRELMRDNP